MTADKAGTPTGQGEQVPHRGPLLRPGSRTSAAVFLCVNLAAYAFANAFVHYLGSGQWFSTTAESYRGSIGRPLGEMLSQPLSVFTHPWMIVVTGLLLAVVVVVPLLVACLYHSRFCGLFLLCVMVLAHAPILGLVLGAGCAVVAGTPLRRRNPALALLLGLMPVGVYLYLSARHLVGAGPLPPAQRLVLCAPFALAALGALVAGAVVLLIAHWTRYRPGVIWPVVAVLLAVPAGLFHQYVGLDELAYALLTGQMTRSESVFSDQRLSEIQRLPNRAPGGDIIAAVHENLQRRRRGRVAECARFLERHGDSRRLSAVLWIKGVTMDTRVSRLALHAGLVQYYDDVPRPESAQTWRDLVHEFPADPRSGVAGLRLARLAIEKGNLTEARELLEAAAGALGDVYASKLVADSTSWWSQLFSDDAGPPSTPYLRRVAVEVGRLRFLMRVNDVFDDVDSGKAFAAYVSLDPRQHYSRWECRQKILDLAEQFAHTKLDDNLALAAAMNVADPVDRAQALQDLEDEPGSDASIEANYELGQLALQAEGIPGLGRILDRPEKYFKRVHDAVANPWQRGADEQLARLKEQERPLP